MPLAPLPISPGGTTAAFPPEPTRIRVRADSAGQGRPVGRLEEVALTGAQAEARELGCKFVLLDQSRIIIAALQRFGRYRSNSGHCATTANRSRMTHCGRHLSVSL